MNASMPPLVSVIIPTHGRKALLARLLDSLAHQTLDPAHFEVIVVHNHTPDGTEEMATRWCADQPFDAFYFKKDYPGPTRSRQFGASVARGQFLAFIDDDCMATPDWLKAGLAAFGQPAAQGSDPVGLVQGQTLPMPDQSQSFPCKTVSVRGPTVFFETCNIFYRREAFDSVGGFSADFLDLFYGEDSDLGWKVTQGGYRGTFAADALVHHEVFRVSFRKWLAEPLYFRNLPSLVRKHPGLRRHMFLRYFLTRETFLFNLALLSLPLVAGRSLFAVPFIAPYLVARFLSGGHVGGVMPRLARVVVGVPRSLCTWYALVSGSIRARCVLL
ncbi:glycosyltransferase family 2 protein [Lysobacter xanthus]